MISGAHLNGACVEIIFTLFEVVPGSDSVNTEHFAHAITRRHCRGLRRGEEQGSDDKSFAECVLNCCGLSVGQ